MRSVSKGAAFLCLLLTLWSAIALVTHHHSSQNEASACQVCVTAHSTVSTSITSTPKPAFHTIFELRLFPTATKQRLISFALCVRPPPVV
jgi:hypothetical protein